MLKPVIFPHFYLSNPAILRHQYLYVKDMLRLHSSNRPARDSKEIKQWIQSLDFPANEVALDEDGAIIARFITVLEQAYKHENPCYFPALQKFGVERTATKTFHFSRKEEWKEAVQTMSDLGFAKPDRSGSWCMSTPKMVQLMVTCATIEYQRKYNLPRCSDHYEHDEMAQVLETLPLKNEKTVEMKRAVLEYSYVVPQELPSMNNEQLIKLREAVLPLVETYQESIQETAKQLETASGENELKPLLAKSNAQIESLNEPVRSIIQTQGYEAVECYAQYRWYPQPDSSFASLPLLPQPVTGKKIALSSYAVSAAEDQAKAVCRYPGCFLWSLEHASYGGGLMKKLFGFFK